MRKKKEELPYILIFVLIAGFAFFLSLKVHLNYPGQFYEPLKGLTSNSSFYPMPIHGDEWGHTAASLYIQETGKIPYENPYTKDSHYTPVESGFQAFLAQFFTLTGLDDLQHFFILPAIFAALSAMSLMILVLKLSDWQTAILSGLFFVALRNDAYIQGIWFMLPITFSLFMMLLSIKFYNDGEDWIFWLFLVAMMFSYPPSAILTIAIISIDIVIKKGFDIKHLYLALLAASVVLVVFISNLQGFADILFFSEGWTKYIGEFYNPLEFLGPITLVLSIAGIAVAVWMKKMKLIMYGLISMAAVTIMFLLLDLTILIPLPRAMYYLFIFMSIFAGFLCSYIIKVLTDTELPFSRIFSSLLILLLIVVLFRGYYTIDGPSKIVIMANQKHYEDLSKIDIPGELIMVPTHLTLASYPISRTKVIATPHSAFEWSNITFLNTFFTGDCNHKKSILDHFNMTLVYNDLPIECDFLKRKEGFNYYAYDVLN